MDIRKKLFATSFSLVLILFVVNFLAMKLYWYVVIPWFDIPTHFVGGVFLGVYTGAMFFNALKKAKGVKFWLIILGTTVVLGVLWEVFEYIVQSTFRANFLIDTTDTIADLIFDTLGGIVGGIFVSRVQNRYNGGHAIIEEA